MSAAPHIYTVFIQIKACGAAEAFWLTTYWILKSGTRAGYRFRFFFFLLYLWAFYAFIVRGQWRADRKTLGGERGAGSAKDLEVGFELRSP